MKSLFFLLLSVFFLNAVKATNYYFSDKSGNDDRTINEAQNPSTPWKTLKKLNSFSTNLKPGDHVLFKRGETFYGSITINTSGSADHPIFFFCLWQWRQASNNQFSKTYELESCSGL